MKQAHRIVSLLLALLLMTAALPTVFGEEEIELIAPPAEEASLPIGSGEDEIEVVAPPAEEILFEEALEVVPAPEAEDEEDFDDVISRAAVIRVQPQDVYVAAGKTASVTITAAGSSLTYQWQVKTPSGSAWTTPADDLAASQTWSFTATADMDGSLYRCVITDAADDVMKSKSCTLHVVTPPIIRAQPANVTVAAGETARISVTAIGTELTYQWQSVVSGGSWTNVAGATDAVLTVTPTAEDDGRQYRCVVTDVLGNVQKTNRMTLTVAAPLAAPEIITLKQNPWTSSKGYNATVGWTEIPGASGYRLYCDGEALDVGAATSYTLTKLSTGPRTFRVEAYNEAVASPASAEQTLSILAAPAIRTQPMDITARAGTYVTISVTAIGTDLTYQWQYMTPAGQTWINCAGEAGQGASLGFTARESWNGRMYRCVVTDRVGSVQKTNRMTLTVTEPLAPPVVVTDPSDQSVIEKENVTLSVVADGAELSYQWQYRTGASGSWVNAASDAAKAADWTFAAKTSFSGRQYRCKVSNEGGTAVSGAMTLTVAAIVPVTGVALDKTSAPMAVDDTLMLTAVVSPSDATYKAIAWSSSDPAVAEVSSEGVVTAKAAGTATITATSAADNSKTAACELTIVQQETSDPSLFRYTVSKGQATITGFADPSKAPDSVILPRRDPQGNLVVAVGSSAFKGNKGLKSVVIPGTVKTIGANAFNGCSGLESVTLPEGLQTIGNYAFYKNSALKSVTIPGSVTSIGSSAFNGCASLKSLKIAGSATALSIGNSAFYGVPLSGALTLPDRVSAIGNYAFYSTEITSLLIEAGSKLKSIGSSAFENSEALAAIVIPGNVKTIGDSAFANCTALFRLRLAEGVQTIVSYAFFRCESLTYITLPATIARIENDAFNSCTDLVTVTIPAPKGSVTIESDAFRNCPDVQIIMN